MFPNMRGEIDMGAIFIGSDPMFYEWCKDLFDHYWELAGYFDVRKTTVV
jgi:predicted transcriptional regulator